MPAPRQGRPRKKEIFANDLKQFGKPILYSDSITGRPSALVSNFRSIAWSPTGGLVATALSSHIRVWNPEKPNVRSSTDLKNAGGTGIVEKLAFCPTHEAVLASTGSDGVCRLWDVRQGGGAVGAGKVKLAECKVGESGQQLIWHPDGREMLVGTSKDIQLVDVRKLNNTMVEGSWDLSARECEIQHQGTQFNGMSFSNSGKELFVTTSDGQVKILDWPSRELLHTLTAHSGSLHVVQQSPTGSFVAAGGDDGIVTIWDTQDWHCASAVMTHTSRVRNLTFSFDGAYLVASSGLESKGGSSGLNITHVETGEHVVTFDTSNPVTWVAWHPFRYWLAYGGDPGGLKIVGAGNSSSIL